MSDVLNSKTDRLLSKKLMGWREKNTYPINLLIIRHQGPPQPPSQMDLEHLQWNVNVEKSVCHMGCEDIQSQKTAPMECHGRL